MVGRLLSAVCLCVDSCGSRAASLVTKEKNPVMSMRPRYFPGAVASGLVVAVCLSGIGCAADTLPTYCGGGGRERYSSTPRTTSPVGFQFRSVSSGTQITRSCNGDTQSVQNP